MNTLLVFAPMLAAFAPPSGIFQLLIWLVCAAVCFAAIWWVIGHLGVPEPLAKGIRAICIVAALIMFIYIMMNLAGGLR